MLLTDDGHLHLYRSIVLDHSWQVDSFPWPRYSSALVYGYGAPLFNFFPPTSYMPTVLLHQFGLNFIDAWLGTMILYTMLAACGAYGLGAQWAGKIGGFVTATAYVYSPYFLFDTVTRGTSNEVSALAILPFAMWGLTRLAHTGLRRDFIFAVFAFAILIPMHNIITLYGTALLATYCVFLFWTSPRRWQAFAQLLSVGIIAMLMAAFFWLPALGETNQVKINNVTEALGFIDVTRSLRPLSEILMLPKTADPTQLQREIPITLGWPQIILGLIGLVLVQRKSNRSLRGLMLWLVALTLCLIALQMPFTAWVWENIPLIGFTQFAWRLISLSSLTLALMAGIGAILLLQEIRTLQAQIAVLSGFVATMIVYAMAWLYTPYIAIQADSILDAHRHEVRAGELALSSYSEYIPIWNSSLLNPETVASFSTDTLIIPRLQSSPDITLLTADWWGTSGTIQISAEQATTLVFDWLYVPGWQAQFLDSDTSAIPLTVRPQPETGLVTIEVPAGSHHIEIVLRNTPLQTASHIISVLGFVLLYLVLVNGWRFWKTSMHETGTPLLPQHTIWLTFIALGITLFLGKALIVDRTQNPIRADRFAGGISSGVEIPLEADLSGLITLLGVNTPETLQSGAEGEIELFWSLADNPLDTDYSSIVQLRDMAGTVIAEASNQYPANLATSNWLPDFYVQDRLMLNIPRGTPPGIYTLDAGLFLPETGQRLDVLNDAGNPIGVRVDLDTIEITRSTQMPPASVSSLATLGDFGLLSTPTLPEVADVGSELNVVWRWRALTDLENDFEAQLIWINEAEEIMATSALVPLTVGFPTSLWQLGDAWRGVHQLYVPGDLEAGNYRVGIELDGENYILGTMQITTPERTFDVPEIQTASDATWENGILLLGYDLREAGMTFYWQTTQPLNESLRLFAHVLDSDERILAQTDGVPVSWSRPTTGWATGEIIMTQHDFGDLDLSNYHVRVGWYEALSEDRIELEDGTDSLILDTQD